MVTGDRSPGIRSLSVHGGYVRISPLSVQRQVQIRMQLKAVLKTQRHLQASGELVPAKCVDRATQSSICYVPELTERVAVASTLFARFDCSNEVLTLCGWHDVDTNQLVNNFDFAPTQNLQ